MDKEEICEVCKWDNAAIKVHGKRMCFRCLDNNLKRLQDENKTLRDEYSRLKGEAIARVNYLERVVKQLRGAEAIARIHGWQPVEEQIRHHEPTDYTALVRKVEDGFEAMTEEFRKSAIGYGDTPEKAVKRLYEEIRGFMECADCAIPEPSPFFSFSWEEKKAR